MLRTFRPASLLKTLAAALFAVALFPAAAAAQSMTELAVYEAATAEEAVQIAEAGRDQLPAIGIGLAVIGGGLGIGLCGFAATGAMSRQPEIAGQIQTAMLIAAVLIEGATIIGLAFCLAV